MSQPLCPKCSQALKDDYGMATCPKCGCFVFIDMDGVAHFSEDETKDYNPPAQLSDSSPDELPGLVANEELASPAPQDISESAEHELMALGFDEEPEAQPVLSDPETHSEPPSAYKPHLEPLSETLSGADAPVHLADESALSPPAEEPPVEEFDMDRILGLGDQPEEAPSADFARPGDPLGTTDYANSEISQAKDGPLIFKILISGIDSKELRQSLRSALEDQRFAWNPQDLMARIAKGVLVIDGVSPVKAVILVNRIKRLPVTVRWEQYEITQMDSN